MEVISQLSLLMGSSFLTGINAYATIGFLGLFGRIGWLNLPQGLEILTHPVVFGIALFLFVLEFFADKVPALDSLWDGIQTFIRIPAGAVLAFAAVGDVSPELKFAALLLGGSLAASAHATKSSIRVMVNLSPEPISNWLLSLSEDGFVLISLWLMFYFPIVMLGIIILFVVFFIWFFPKILKIFKGIFQKIINIFRSHPQPQ